MADRIARFLELYLQAADGIRDSVKASQIATNRKILNNWNFYPACQVAIQNINQNSEEENLIIRLY